MSNMQHQSPLYYRCFAKIDLDAIGHNFDQLKSRLEPGVLALATVKANAYGHGAVPVSRYLEEKCDYFAVACIDEAVELRQGGIQKPILILSYTDPTHYETLILQNITATLFSVSEAQMLSQLAEKLGKKAKVHVAVDTGMGRIGFSPDEVGADSVLAISRLSGIELEGIFSHLACADQRDKEDAFNQVARFESFLALLDQRGVSIPIKHISNSAAAMEMNCRYDMCRFGIALYGLYPSEEVDQKSIALRPAMEVVSHVIHIKEVPKGFQIGYGHIYTAPEKRRIATVSIGYADGFNRCLTEKGSVLIRGKRAAIVGRVCMDQIMVDITDIDGVTVGDHAVVLGKSEGETISAEAFGALTHSFNYEVVCTFMPRVKRVYYREGKLISE